LIVSGSSTSAEQFHAALGATPSLPSASGEATLTKTSVRLADRARRLRASPSRQWAFLRSLATRRSWSSRPDRDVQRGQSGHSLGGRLPEGVPDANGHARAGERQSGFIGRESARRNGRAGG
jgi:hypothetical protein